MADIFVSRASSADMAFSCASVEPIDLAQGPLPRRQQPRRAGCLKGESEHLLWRYGHFREAWFSSLWSVDFRKYGQKTLVRRRFIKRVCILSKTELHGLSRQITINVPLFPERLTIDEQKCAVGREKAKI